MRLSYALELVLALGFGMAWTRYRVMDPELAEVLALSPWFVTLERGGDAFFAGVSLVGGLGLFFEWTRGRSPMCWGIGRWVWSVAGIYLASALFDHIGDTASGYLWAAGKLPRPFHEEVLRGLRWNYWPLLLPEASAFVLAIFLTSLAAGPPRDPSPDAREWSGRVFAAALVIAAVVLKVLFVRGSSPPIPVMGGGIG